MKIERNQVVLPLNLEILLPEGDPVRKTVEILDSLDYTDLYETYPDNRTIQIRRQKRAIFSPFLLSYSFFAGFRLFRLISAVLT